jgi:hypothetical protein
MQLKAVSRGDRRKRERNREGKCTNIYFSPHPPSPPPLLSCYTLYFSYLSYSVSTGRMSERSGEIERVMRRRGEGRKCGHIYKK